MFKNYYIKTYERNILFYEEWNDESRYFTAEFSFGLKAIKDKCDLFNVKNENITKVWKWYQNVAIKMRKKLLYLS